MKSLVLRFLTALISYQAGQSLIVAVIPDEMGPPQLGPLYLLSNILGGAAGMLIDGNWHGPHNWNEVGPQQPQPVPWPR